MTELCESCSHAIRSELDSLMGAQSGATDAQLWASVNGNLIEVDLSDCECEDDDD